MIDHVLDIRSRVKIAARRRCPIARVTTAAEARAERNPYRCAIHNSGRRLVPIADGPNADGNTPGGKKSGFFNLSKG
jgi:hypothetical protein